MNHNTPDLLFYPSPAGTHYPQSSSAASETVYTLREIQHKQTEYTHLPSSSSTPAPLDDDYDNDEASDSDEDNDNAFNVKSLGIIGQEKPVNTQCLGL